MAAGETPHPPEPEQASVLFARRQQEQLERDAYPRRHWVHGHDAYAGMHSRLTAGVGPWEYDPALLTVTHRSRRYQIDLEQLTTPTELCPDDIDPRFSFGTARECGWTAAATFSCTPGEIGRVGCSSACGLGTCTGNPMLRVCDADRPDGNCTHPTAVDPFEPGGGESNDFAGPCPCDLSVTCPPSGSIQVFTAPFRDGEPYTCDVAFEE